MPMRNLPCMSSGDWRQAPQRSKAAGRSPPERARRPLVRPLPGKRLWLALRGAFALGVAPRLLLRQALRRALR